MIRRNGFVRRRVAGRLAAAAAVMANPDPATLDRLAADAASGVMRVPITRTYPLHQAPRALADFAAGSLGKLAITL